MNSTKDLNIPTNTSLKAANASSKLTPRLKANPYASSLVVPLPSEKPQSPGRETMMNFLNGGDTSNQKGLRIQVLAANQSIQSSSCASLISPHTHQPSMTSPQNQFLSATASLVQVPPSGTYLLDAHNHLRS